MICLEKQPLNELHQLFRQFCLHKDTNDPMMILSLSVSVPNNKTAHLILQPKCVDEDKQKVVALSHSHDLQYFVGTAKALMIEVASEAMLVMEWSCLVMSTTVETPIIFQTYNIIDTSSNNIPFAISSISLLLC
jgi:hypothetical protein